MLIKDKDVLASLYRQQPEREPQADLPTTPAARRATVARKATTTTKPATAATASASETQTSLTSNTHCQVDDTQAADETTARPRGKSGRKKSKAQP